MQRPIRRDLLAFVVLIAVIVFFVYKHFSESREAEHRLSMEKIVSIRKLELVRIHIKDVLSQTKERPLFLPNATALLIVDGEVYAGITFCNYSRG